MNVYQPLSLIRLTHEGIKIGLQGLQDLLNDNSSLALSRSLKELKTIYLEAKRVIQLHHKQEQYLFHKALEKQQKESENSLPIHRQSPVADFLKIEQAFEAASHNRAATIKLIDALNIWAADYQEELKQEDEFLMNATTERLSEAEFNNIVNHFVHIDYNEFKNFQFSWVYERLPEKQQASYLKILQNCSTAENFTQQVEPPVHNHAI